MFKLHYNMDYDQQRNYNILAVFFLKCEHVKPEASSKVDLLFPPTLSWPGSDAACSGGYIKSAKSKIMYRKDEPLPLQHGLLFLT